MENDSSIDGTVVVPGGRVWYKVVHPAAPGTPLFVLHGGPGSMHHYLEPLEALAEGRPVVFYDQLGCGASDMPDDPSLWTVARFVEELGLVREAAGYRHIHLLGHSWGAMLALDFALLHPDGVRSVVFASPALSIPRWRDDADALVSGLPAETREILRRPEEAGTVERAEYKAAAKEFYRRHLFRPAERPPYMGKSRDRVGKQVYRTMWGPEEYRVTGNLLAEDRTERLKDLRVPVLYTCGRHDEATPASTTYFHERTPGSRLEIFEESAHLPHAEEPERYASVVGAFLRMVDGKTE